jgi:hypothetical protein
MSLRGSTTVTDRVFASLPYLVPLLHGLFFSSFFFNVFPALVILVLPLKPLLELYSLPLVSLILFFALFFGVVRNENIQHFIRFNTMQALLVDIMLVIVSIVLPIINNIVGVGFVTTALYNFVFLGVVAIVIFSVVQSLRGLYAEIPTLSDAVYMQVR